MFHLMALNIFQTEWPFAKAKQTVESLPESKLTYFLYK